MTGLVPFLGAHMLQQRARVETALHRKVASLGRCKRSRT